MSGGGEDESLNNTSVQGGKPRILPGYGLLTMYYQAKFEKGCGKFYLVIF